MPTFIHIGNGTRTTYRCPSNSTLKHPYVDGKFVHYVTADQQTLTLEVPPASGAILEIFVDPPDDANGNAPAIGVPIEHLVRPLLPLVRFHGDPSQDNPFTVDFQAKTMDVHSFQVFADY